MCKLNETVKMLRIRLAYWHQFLQRWEFILDIKEKASGEELPSNRKEEKAIDDKFQKSKRSDFFLSGRVFLLRTDFFTSRKLFFASFLPF